MQHEAAVCQLTHARLAGNGSFLRSSGSVFCLGDPRSGGIGAAGRVLCRVTSTGSGIPSPGMPLHLTAQRQSRPSGPAAPDRRRAVAVAPDHVGFTDRGIGGRR